MYYKKKGLPDEGDVVVVTVKKILYHSIFAELDEYENKEGMIHISEIAPGRIRNIRDYVREGKKLVCVVLSLNKEKGHIDLSLRRVPQSLRIKKNDEFKQEVKSEKLLEYIGKQVKVNLAGMYKKVGNKLIEEFGLLGIAFNEISVNGEKAIKDLKVDAKIAKVLIEVVQDKIKPLEVSITSIFELRSNGENGIEDIKESLLAGDKVASMEDTKVAIAYISAPKYKVEVFGSDYKSVEADLENITNAITKEAKKRKVYLDIKRKK
jgi:translation initiation factor 2 subunit 1